MTGWGGACAGNKAIPQESEDAIEYRAPFVLPWIVIDSAMAQQPESFVPFTTGSQGGCRKSISPL